MSKDDDADVVQEAQDRFKRCNDFEADFRVLFVEDLRFCNADSDNKYQWPTALSRSRELDARPCLTINKTRQHALMIQNEIKQNLPAVKISPTGGDASYDSAQVYNGIIRYIEYNSNAADAYDTAMTHQVQGGIGYWRVATDYKDQESFDQEIFIKRIKDPMSVFLDVDAKEADGSDSEYGFIFDDLTRDEFERKYPKNKDIGGRSAFGNGNDWLSKDKVRVAEYFYCEYKTDWLVALPIRDPQTQQPLPGQYDTLYLSTIPQQLRQQIKESPDTKQRKVQVRHVKWCLIAGDEIIDRKDWPGQYIPIVRVVGEEMVIDGTLDRKGHVRNLKDPQRMYNYWTSSAVEQVALQGKQPYIASVQAIAGFETYYQNANRINYSYLPFNSKDENGQPVPPPQREQPPQMAPAYITGMQIAGEEMKMVSGQSDPTMGMQANEIAGVAIQKRIKQGDKATFHYIDNLSKAIRYTGKIIVDLIPKIYDTPRVVRILAEDGSDEQIQIDPKQQQALTTQHEDQRENEASRIFNPAVGKYDVVAQAGPSYATKREEAAEAMTAIAVQSPDFLAKAGDIFFKTMDFPGSEELAERYRNSIPQALLGEGPTPEMQQLQQQLQEAQQQLENTQGQLSSAIQALSDEKRSLDDKEKRTEIEAYRAMTTRMNDFFTRQEELGVTPALAAVQAQTMASAVQQPDPYTDPGDQPQAMQPDPQSMPVSAQQAPSTMGMQPSQ
jgi:Phage P22-like portal protein